MIKLVDSNLICSNLLNKTESNKYKISENNLALTINANNREYAHGKSFKPDSIKWIVVHYTACVNVSAKSMCKSMTSNTEASTHFYVDENDIYQSVPLKYIAWHVGDGKCKQPNVEKRMSLKELSRYHARDWRYDLAASNHLKWQSENDDFTGNSVSLGVDICVKKVSNKTKKATDLDWYFEPNAIDNTAKLVAYLMQRYNIDIQHVIRHGDATGKLCPRCFISTSTDNRGDTAWNNFKSLVEQYSSYNIIAEVI